MMHDAPAKDPRLVWQRQAREHAVISLEEVRLKAEIAQRRVRRNLAIAFILALLLLVLCSIAFVNSTAVPIRVIAAAMMVLTVVAICKAWYRIWPLHTLSPNAALVGCNDFYRNELMAQYRSAAIIWRLLVPVVIFTFLLWNAVFRTNPLVPKILLPGLLVLLFFARRREVRQLKRSLASLDDFEREISQ